jgi:hypothetical protein
MTHDEQAVEMDDSFDGQDADGMGHTASAETLTDDELLEQAQANAQAAIIATVAFLRDEGLSIEHWAHALGGTFALGWDDPRPWDAGEFLDAMLTNFRSIGATVLSSQIGDDAAEADIRDFPDLELCALFGVDPQQVALFNNATAVIASQRGLTWEWRLADGQTHYVVRRAVS